MKTWVVSAATIALLFGCGRVDFTPDATADSAPPFDSGMDADGSSPLDAGPDATADSTPPRMDSAPPGDADPPMDAVADVEVDAGPLMVRPSIQITTVTSSSRSVSMAWNGTHLGLAWQDDRDGNAEIYFRLLDPSGTPVGDEVRVTDDMAQSAVPSLVWNGAEWGVAWVDGRDGRNEIYFTRLTAMGAEIGTNIRVTNEIDSRWDPSLVATPSGYAVAWNDGRDGANDEIYFARLDASGAKIGSDVRITDTDNAWCPSLVASGGQFALAWYDYRPLGDDIYVELIDTMGVVAGIDSRISTGADAFYPSMTRVEGGYAVAWMDGRDGNNEVYFALVDGSGARAAPEVRITDSVARTEYPSLAFAHGGFGLAYDDAREGNDEVYFAELDRSGNPLRELRVSAAMGTSTYPVIAATSDGYAIAWEDNRDGTYQLYFAAVTR